MDKQYSFIFTYAPSATVNVPTTPDSNAQNVPTTPKATESSGTGEDFAQGIAKRTTGYLQQQMLAPLNQVTGGMATPTFNLAKTVITGAGAGAIGGAAVMLVIQGLQLAISKIQERIAKNEAKAAEMNERDNLLIKSGAKTTATFYTGNFNGVKSTERK